MRIFLLPLTTRQALIYCQKPAQQAAKPASYSDRITNYAAKTWAKWEAAEKGWQKALVSYGNKGLQRIPYQEWGLKSFPPGTPKAEAATVTDAIRHDVIYPGNVMHSDDVPKVMRRLARDRRTLHWNRFIGCALGMPLTAPFALVPIIPNIPFFYLAFRCWSHWRALKGADHLDSIVEHRLYRPKSTPTIEELYDEVAPESPDFNFVTPAQIKEKTVPEEKVILTRDSHLKISKRLQVPELGGEIERAVWQVDQALRQGGENSEESSNREHSVSRKKAVSGQQATRGKRGQ